MDRYTVSGKKSMWKQRIFLIQIFLGVLSDIKNDWDLDNWQGGLIQTSFVICYFASAPIFGFLGDRYSRKWLMAAGVFAWGGCTLISSFMPVRG